MKSVTTGRLLLLFGMLCVIACQTSSPEPYGSSSGALAIDPPGPHEPRNPCDSAPPAGVCCQSVSGGPSDATTNCDIYTHDLLARARAAFAASPCAGDPDLFTSVGITCLPNGPGCGNCLAVAYGNPLGDGGPPDAGADAGQDSGGNTPCNNDGVCQPERGEGCLNCPDCNCTAGQQCESQPSPGVCTACPPGSFACATPLGNFCLSPPDPRICDGNRDCIGDNDVAIDEVGCRGACLPCLGQTCGPDLSCGGGVNCGIYACDEGTACDESIGLCIPQGGGGGECTTDFDCQARPNGTCLNSHCTYESSCICGESCAPDDPNCGSGGGGDECQNDSDCSGGFCGYDGYCVEFDDHSRLGGVKRGAAKRGVSRPR